MLQITELDKTYPNGVHALDKVSLEISTGMFGLLGPNGAGKSTLMRTIATLQPADGGSIRFGDIDVLNEPEKIRRTLGYLPQDFGVYPRISAQDMLDHMAVLKGISNRKLSATNWLPTCFNRPTSTMYAKKHWPVFQAGCVSASVSPRR